MTEIAELVREGRLETVGMILGDAPPPRRDGNVQRIVLPVRDHTPAPLAPGIYFGLSEDEYHAQPAGSTSGIKNAHCSPIDFYVNSWLKPVSEDDADEKEKIAFTVGKAYHKRILEGRGAFYAVYAAQVDPADHPDALRTVAHLTMWLDENEIVYKKSAAKPALIQHVLDADPLTEIWDDVVSKHGAANAGKTLLPSRTIVRLEIAAAMIERHPDLKGYFHSGYPEVSLFWTCEKTGLPMKARMDYLRIGRISDLKTVSNPMGKRFEIACTSAIAGRGYYIQAAVYQEGLAAVKRLILAHGMGVVHGDCDHDWVAHLASSPVPRFTFVFMQSGPAPVTLGINFSNGLMAYGIGENIALDAKRTIASYCAEYGADWWIMATPTIELEDTALPAYIGE
jgi:hypothetical protein